MNDPEPRPDQEEVTCPACGHQLAIDVSDGLAHDFVCVECSAEFSAAPIDLFEHVPEDFRDLKPPPEPDPNSAAQPPRPRQPRPMILVPLGKKSQTYRSLAVIVILLGVLSTVAFAAAGVMLLGSGTSLTGLESVSGDTVAEAYYQEIGVFEIAFGIGFFAFAMAVFTTSLALGGLLLERGTRRGQKRSTASASKEGYGERPEPETRV